jgi:hypothetical protein
MHRDFYRSQEGEFEAIEPSGRLKAVRGRPKPEAPEGPPPRLRQAQKPAKSAEPLTPLRSSSEGDFEPSDRVELEPSDTVVIPRTVKPNLNIPLVACLLFVVGVFLWREQTRPRLTEQSELPIPKVVTVVEEEAPNSVLREEGPYPEMSPSVTMPNNPATSPEPVETTAAESMDPDALPADVEPAMSEEEPHAPLPAAEASEQRAAILERMNDGNVSRSDRATRTEERQTAPSNASLFPDTEPVAPPPRTAPPSRPEPRTEPRTAPAEDSLFPAEPAAVAAPSKPTPAQPAPPSLPTPPKRVKPVPVLPSQGEPYRIAEPDL